MPPRLKYAASCASVDLPGAKKQDSASAFKVNVEAPSASVPFGRPVTLNASASGGKSPYSYAWSSGAGGSRATMTPGWAGEWTVTVTATDAEGKIGEGKATLRVSPQQVKLTGIKPQAFYGSQATLSLPGKEAPPPPQDPCVGRSYTSHNPFDECATVKIDPNKSVSVAPRWDDGNRPAAVFDPNTEYVPPAPALASGKQRVVWQAEPALEFAPPTSEDGRTRVTYSRMGPVKLWCEIQQEVSGVFHTVGECDQETVNVVSPKFSVRFTPAEGQGRIGQDVRLRINSEPGIADDLIDFRWSDPPTSNRLELTANAREIDFKVKDAKPVVLKALARVPHHGDSIAEVGATYTGLEFEVKVWVEEPGTRPMMWDPVKGGLKPVPKGQYATHERIPLRAQIQGGGAPSGLRWSWTVNDGTTISNPVSQTPTVSRTSPGGIEAHVEVRAAEGSLLGGGDVSASVIEVRDTPPPPANPTVNLSADHNTVERGRSVSFSANASGGKPPYSYAWQGASGQGAQTKLTPVKIGSQTVSVMVTDSKGRTGTASVEITVTLSSRDIARDKAGKLADQAGQQAKAGDLAGAAKSVEEARQHDPESARAVAAQVRDQAKKAASDAEKKRDFKTSGSLFDAARRADPADQDAHIGLNNAVAYQQRQDAMATRQGELASHIARGDWHLAETSQAELKIMDEGLPGGLTDQTRALIRRYEEGKAAYGRHVEAKRKEIAAEVEAGRYDNARRKLSDLRSIHLIPTDQDWSRKVEQAIDKVEAESRARGGSGKPGDSSAGSQPPLNGEPLVTGIYNGPGIQVRTGNYGHNCGARFGNATRHLADACDGKARCEYRVDYTQIGDPAPGCGKDYVAVWKCPNDATWYAANAAPEAGFGKIVLLQCPGDTGTALPPGSTFAGGNQGADRHYPVDLTPFGGKKGTLRTVNNVSIDDASWLRFKSTDEKRLAMDIPIAAPAQTDAVAVVSNLDDSTYLEQGKAIARITVRKDSGDETLDILAGVHSSEWNYGVGPKHARFNAGDIGDNRFLAVLPLKRPGMVRGLKIDYVETNAPKWYGHAPGFCLRGITLVRDTQGIALTPSANPASTATPTQAAASAAGKWKTSEGELTLNQSGNQVSGSYTNDGGEIVGEMNGNVLEGWWIENGSSERCATAKNGRHHWGRIRWTFDSGKFTGTWSYCDKPVASGGGWNGERIGGVSAATLGAKEIDTVKAGKGATLISSGVGTATDMGDGEWSVVETLPGMYRLEQGKGEVRIARQGNNPGGLQHAGLRLNRGLPVAGDFSAQVSFSDALIEGGLNQIELQASFADGAIFFVVRDRDGGGSHIWAPGLQGNQVCGRAGSLRMERRGDTVTGYCDGKPIWSASRKAPLKNLQFVLQNNGTNDPISVTFRDWRFAANARQGSNSNTVNLAQGKPASQSSRSQWSRPDDPQGAVDGVINGGYAFHTDNQANPWWQVDLGKSYRLADVRLFNRLDCCSERARTVQVMLSDDGRVWRTAYRHNGSIFGGKDGKPLVVPLNRESARYLRLQLNESTWFHLDEVEVHGAN